jgi:hypothetical protein
MAPFHPSTGGTAGQRSGGRDLARLQTHPSSPMSVSDENAPQPSTNHPSNLRAESNDAPRSSLGPVLSLLHLGRRGKRGQPIPTANPSQIDAGMAEPTPLESEPGPPLFTQQDPQSSDTEMELQDVTWLVHQLASSDTRARGRSSDDDASPPDSHQDDANSDHLELISDNEDEDEDDNDDEAEDDHQHALLGAYNPTTGQPVFVHGVYDTGATVSVMSSAKARQVAPDGASDDFLHFGIRTVDTLGGLVTLHGPIWVTFCLRNRGSRTQYNAPFYVLPSRYGEGGFDALLSIKLVRRLGLVNVLPDGPAARGARREARRRGRDEPKLAAPPLAGSAPVACQLASWLAYLMERL